MADWTNSDGLEVRFVNPEAGQTGAGVSTLGAVKNLVLDFNFATAITAAADGHEAFIPAGSYIKSATLIVTSPMTGTSGTLSIGLAQKDGTAISATAIDNAIAQADIDAAYDAVACNGTYVGGLISIGAYNGYVYTTLGGTVTAGRGRLVIEYIEV